MTAFKDVFERYYTWLEGYIRNVRRIADKPAMIAPDPECDLDYTPNAAVRADLTLGISDSLGFGGHNACIAFRKYPQ